MARLLCNEEKFFVAAGKELHAFARNDMSQKIKVDIVDVSNALPKIAKPRAEEEKQENEAENAKPEKAQILCLALTSDSTLLAAGTSLKTVLLYNSADLTLIRAFRIPKAPTSISFDQEGQFIIVGDRAGNVCRYSVAAPEKNEGHKDITGEMCNFEGEPLMGAISMVLDVAVSSKYLVVADRDEKVRIHRYPKAYVLEAVGLGHIHYVSSVDFAGDRLFSAGGDSSIREWELSTGRELSMTETLDEQPIKKIISFVDGSGVTICAIFDKKDVLYMLKEEDGHFHFSKEISAGAELIDVCQHNGVVVGLTREGLAVFDLSAGTATSIAVEDELKTTLETIKEAVTNYFKNVTHQNMLDYQKRKEEKMSKEKEKKQRKRKNNQNGAQSEPKKAAVV